MEIVTSKVSVYEVELDLKRWDKIDSSQVPSFYAGLSESIPSVKEHKCMSGKAGGFLAELRKGTNFAHVIEHVLLELISLADPEKQVYTGWTREKGDHQYVIHYGAPDFLTGRLAAILGVDIVKRLINEESIDLEHYIGLLKQPSKYFTQDARVSENLLNMSEPASVIQELESSPVERREAAPVPQLSDEQRANIQVILKEVKKHVRHIVELWSKSFLEYSGNFGRAIIDKIELINVDRFMPSLLAGDFDGFFRGVKNVCYVISSYRIPMHFLTHSIWLYKNHLMGYIIEEHKDEKEFLHQAVQDFEDFYQIILQNVSVGFETSPPAGSAAHLRELKEFRELKESKELILAVDDDEITRRAFRDILEYHGYRTILARDGNQALEILREKGTEITLVILDLFMPGMDGREVYSRIKERYPTINILVSSGYPIDNETGDMLTRDLVCFISKPFKVEEFLVKVQSLLERGTKPDTSLGGW